MQVDWQSIAITLIGGGVLGGIIRMEIEWWWKRKHASDELKESQRQTALLIRLNRNAEALTAAIVSANLPLTPKG